jgi:hypothetical protein
MKGVRMIRVKFVPEANCDNTQCAFFETGPRARSLAQAHVRTTGHTVHVIVEDSTAYSPERQS